MTMWVALNWLMSESSDGNETLRSCRREVKVKVKQSRYIPGVAQRVPGS